MDFVKYLKLKAKKYKLILLGNVNHFKRSININHQWLGDEGAGFYVYLDKLNKNSIVYSFGVGENISFDLKLIDLIGCKVYGFDPTPKSIDWVKKNNKSEDFIFFPYGIGDVSEKKIFYLPKNSQNVSGSILKTNYVSETEKIEVDLKSLTDIMKTLNHTSIDLLKMDIEGAEYDVLKNILASSIEIHQLVVEFHDRSIEDGYNKSKEIVDLLINKGYRIFAVSNTFEEISFIKE